MSICIFKHFLQHIEDEEIKAIVTFAMQSSEKHINFIREIYSKEDIGYFCTTPRKWLIQNYPNTTPVFNHPMQQ